VVRRVGAFHYWFHWLAGSPVSRAIFRCWTPCS